MIQRYQLGAKNDFVTKTRRNPHCHSKSSEFMDLIRRASYSQIVKTIRKELVEQLIQEFVGVRVTDPELSALTTWFNSLLEGLGELLYMDMDEIEQLTHLANIRRR